jgi:adenine-specific DNA-methyltransferase
VIEVRNIDLVQRAEARRTAALSRLDSAEQSARGQYFTPYLAARIITALPRVPQRQSIKVLDPALGAGF